MKNDKNNPHTVEGEGMDYSTYLWDRARKVEPGKPSRELHKELISYFGRGSGMPFSMRYPNLPIYTSITMSLLSIIISSIVLLLK